MRVGRTPTGDAKPPSVSGTLARERLRVVGFPGLRLSPGRYRFQVVVTSKRSPKLRATRTSPIFAVR